MVIDSTALSGRFGTILLAFIESRGIDLAVMGTRSKTGFAGLNAGSAAERVFPTETSVGHDRIQHDAPGGALPFFVLTLPKNDSRPSMMCCLRLNTTI